jgi:hypothetical protein
MSTFKGEISAHIPKFLNTYTKLAERKWPLHWSTLCLIVNLFTRTSIISSIYALLLVQRHSHQSSCMLPYSWLSKEPTSVQASNFRSRWIPFLHPTLKSNQEAIFIPVMSTTVMGCWPNALLFRLLPATEQLLHEYLPSYDVLLILSWSILHKLFLDYKAYTSAKVEQELCSYFSIPQHNFFWTNSFSTCTGQIRCPLLNVLSLYVGSDKAY